MYNIFIKPITNQLLENGYDAKIQLLSPPSSELGDFCIVVNRFARKQDPEFIGKALVEELKIDGIDSISLFVTKGKKNKTGIVYLNFSIAEDKKKEINLSFIKKASEYIFSKSYSYLDINKEKTAVVEHTSANPISPLHVGNIRNSVHGDTLARILERTGFKVYKHFYVNDVGLQVSFVVVGYEMAKERGVRPEIKFDLWLGQVYAIMNCLYTIQIIKNKGQECDLDVEKSYKLSDDEVNLFTNHYNELLVLKRDELSGIEKVEKQTPEQKRMRKDLKRKIKRIEGDLSEVIKYKNTFVELKERFPKLFEVLFEEVSKIDLVERQTSYLKSYEKNSDKRIVSLFKEVTLWILESIKWTLARYNIGFDTFDFESELSWSGLPDKLIDLLEKSEYTINTGGQGVRLQYSKNAIDKLLKETGLTRKDIPIRGQVPDLQLRRSNGTLLYAAKDIAYSIKKFQDRDPQLVYNVISTEQSLPQFQLLLPLLELGYPLFAQGLKHYAYELVDLSGRAMSGRMASYVTADAFYDETYIRSRMAKRASDGKRDIKPPTNPKAWKEEHKILHAVTLASTRYPLIDKSPLKRIVLDLDQELDFKRNPGPFIQYAHARCCGILRNVKDAEDIVPDGECDWEMVVDDVIVEIVSHLTSIDEVIIKSFNNLDPSVIATWCFQLAQYFMKFYEKYPVLKAENHELMKARLNIIEMIKRGISNGLDILGIPAANKL